VRDVSTKWGLALSDLFGGDLSYVSNEFSEHPEQTINLFEKFAPYQNEIIEERWPHSFESWDRLYRVSHYLPLKPYFDQFTFEDLAKYKFGSVVESAVGRFFERHRVYQGGDEDIEHIPPEPFEFVYKLKNSLHHYGRYLSNWNLLVDAYYAIPSFNFGNNFETRFDHSSYFNYWGTAQHVYDTLAKKSEGMSWTAKEKFYEENILYLDGVFGYLIHLNGKHVLTIGFSLADGKILLSQIQLRNIKGNRWLYKLPTNLLNYVVDRLYTHFSKFNLDIYLVSGESLAKRIATIHTGTKLPDSVFTRIVNFYSLPLQKYKRYRLIKRKEMEYYLLRPKPDQRGSS